MSYGSCYNKYKYCWVMKFKFVVKNKVRIIYNLIFVWIEFMENIVFNSEF